MRNGVLRSVTLVMALGLPGVGLAQSVDQLVAKNVTARGGAQAWRSVTSLRLTGKMDVGQGVRAPYVLEQKRPGKMRLEFEFDGATSVQCSDGKKGWKVVPFRGRTTPEPLTDQEVRETAASADPYGLLFDYASRGYKITLQGREKVEGRDTFKLKVVLPGGAVRWVFLDAESGLEVRVDAVQTVAGRARRLETYYGDWRAQGGLLFPRRYEMRTEGSPEPHQLTVETVQVNPVLDDGRFVMPAVASSATRGGQ